MGKKVLFRLCDFLLGLISVVLALLATGGALASRLHPVQFPLFQWFGLFLPLVLGANVVIALFWLLRRQSWFVFPLLAILLNIPFLSGVIQWSYSKNDLTRKDLKVATYNIQEGMVGGYPEVVYTKIASFMEAQEVDILCLQEFPEDKELQGQMIDEMVHAFPYYEVHALSPQGIHVALFSRYPILQTKSVSFEMESKNTTMWADIDVGGHMVRVFNTHLQTTNLNQNRIGAPKSIREGLIRVNKLKDVMTENTAKRAVQADHVRELMDRSPYPLIVCGDFNDTPASFVYHRVKGKLRDSFRSCGRGYGYTYRYLNKLLRIDYILYSPETFTGIRYDSPELEYSDHKPVIVSLDFNATTISLEE